MSEVLESWFEKIEQSEDVKKHETKKPKQTGIFEVLKRKYFSLRQKMDYAPEMLPVRNPSLLEGKVVEYIREEGFPSQEVFRIYEEQKELLIELFGVPESGFKKGLFFHGTGLFKYKGEKYGKDGQTVDHGSLVSVFDNILENGLVPHHDQWFPTKDVETVSLAANYFYAKWYADKNTSEENRLQWQLGDPDDWFNFMMADSLKDDLIKGLKGRKNIDTQAVKRTKIKRQENSLNLVHNWASGFNSKLTPSTPINEIIRCRTDISDNWGVVLCIDSKDVKEITMPVFESHELRTDQKIEPLSIKAVGVPLAHLDDVKVIIESHGLLDVEVFALECADLHLAAFPFEDLVKRYK